MVRPPVDDRLLPLDLLARNRPRRRRRPGIEVQQGRCPVCERVMVLRVSRFGPRYYCACDERRGA